MGFLTPVTAVSVHPRSRVAGERKGVLLLVVLSMLTLFLMLGSTYLVIALRAEKVSHAFSKNIDVARASQETSTRYVDEAFFTFVRGTAIAPDAPVLANHEDLLGDKYGQTPPATGEITAAAVFRGSPQFIELTTTNVVNVTSVSELPGRVITLRLPRLNVSTRVLHAQEVLPASTPRVMKIVIASVATVSGRPMTAGDISAVLAFPTAPQPPHFIINGREFDGSVTNERFDAFSDSLNPLLSRIAVNPDPMGTGTPELTKAPLYASMTLTDPLIGIDNDNDGIRDSAFLDVGLAPFMDAAGLPVFPKAAVLVVDLDGRLNLNAHDSAVDEETYDPAVSGPMYPDFDPGTGPIPVATLPRGPAGVAGISIRKAEIFPSTIAYAADNEFLSTATVRRGVSDATTLDRRPPTAAPSYPARPTPGLGGVEGRYGGTQFSSDTDLSPAKLSAPGAVGINDGPSTDVDRWLLPHFPLDPLDPATRGFNWLTAPFLPSSNPTYLGTPFAPVAARYGTPPDPKGRMRIWIDPATGVPVYYTPFWDPATRGLVDDPLVDDPYEVNLTKTASRLAVHRHGAKTATGNPASDNVDSLYSPSDLEGILRYLETDSPRLSRRLVSLMGNSALDNRHLLTTESWDTTAIVGPLWEDVIRSPFTALLDTPIPSGVFAPGTLADPYYLLSRESRMGHKFDVNRPFHDVDISEPYWEDTDGDGIPDVFTGEQRRQAFARQLYVLFRAIVEHNNPGIPLTTDQARALAQYAVNIVDFRDADSTMTKFDFDPTYVVGGSWDLTAVETVWGCERPDLVITETFAWHDRRTDDLSAGGGTVETPSAADDDFDQKRRPRGAFFVELTNPWGSFAAEYDTSSQQIVPKLDLGSGSYSLRGDPIPEDLAATFDPSDAAATDRFSTDAGISLDAISTADGSGNRYPVWRLASVRGKVDNGTAFGADASYAGGGTDYIVDPASPTSTAIVDRLFYFAPPPLPLDNEFVGHPAYVAGTPGATAANPVPVFWQATPGGVNPAYGRSVVVGTDATVNPGLAGTTPPAGQLPQRVFSNNMLPGTLTEPVPFDASVDAYVQLNGGSNFSTGSTPDDASWSSPVDEPLDAKSLPVADFSGTRLEQDGSGDPLLMLNGTHANFAVIHLQRLADPSRPWDATDNPYLTVDSLPVDLNVINTNAAGQNVDEPGATPAGAELAYLQNQLEYRGTTGSLGTVERGGNHSATSKEANLWCSRVNTDAGPDPDVENVELPNAFQSVPAAPRAAVALDGTGKLQPYSLPGLAAGNTSLLPTDSASPPTRALAQAPFPWMFFPNRPYDSVAELSLVPTTSAFHLLKKYTVDTGLEPEFFHLAGYWESATPPKPAPVAGDPPLPFSWHQLTGRETGRAAALPYPGPPLPGLLDFLHVPSRFSAVYATVPDNAVNDTAMTALGLDQSPTRQLSHYREPGRVNVNTITDQKTWRALFGGLDANGDVSTVSAGTLPDLPRWGLDVFGPDALPPDPPDPPPARHARNLLDFFGKLPAPSPPGTLPMARNAGDRDLPPVDEGFLNNHAANYLDTDRNPFFRYQTMSQLSERVTTRSNVFAIWVTVGYFQGANEVLPRSRGFFIFDRSIPVAYEKGKNHNVEDAILLRRIIQ